jgi:hypothetical protein
MSATEQREREATTSLGPRSYRDRDWVVVADLERALADAAARRRFRPSMAVNATAKRALGVAPPGSRACAGVAIGHGASRPELAWRPFDTGPALEGSSRDGREERERKRARAHAPA